MPFLSYLIILLRNYTDASLDIKLVISCLSGFIHFIQEEFAGGGGGVCAQ